MADRTWKKVERDHCRELGGERTGPTGRDCPDCTGTPGLGLEIKAYKKFVFLTADWGQAVENAAKLYVTPALLVREGGRGGRRLVQMHQQDFLDWWTTSRLRPIRLHQMDTERGLVRLDWADFVRLYHATHTVRTTIEE